MQTGKKDLRKKWGEEDMEKLKKQVDRVTSPSTSLQSMVEQKLQQKRGSSREMASSSYQPEKSPTFIPYGSEVSYRSKSPEKLPVINDTEYNNNDMDKRTKSPSEDRYRAKSPSEDRYRTKSPKIEEYREDRTDRYRSKSPPQEFGLSPAPVNVLSNRQDARTRSPQERVHNTVSFRTMEDPPPSYRPSPTYGTSIVTNQNPSPPRMDIPSMEITSMDIPNMDIPSVEISYMDSTSVKLPSGNIPTMEINIGSGPEPSPPSMYASASNEIPKPPSVSVPEYIKPVSAPLVRYEDTVEAPVEQYQSHTIIQ